MPISNRISLVQAKFLDLIWFDIAIFDELHTNFGFVAILPFIAFYYENNTPSIVVSFIHISFSMFILGNLYCSVS